MRHLSGSDLPTDELARAAALRSALRRFSARTEAVSSDTGLSSEQYNFLLMLQAAELVGAPVTVNELEDRSTLQQTAVAELVDRSERAGLVRREPVPGAPGVAALPLTAEGRRRLVAAFVALRDDRAELARAVAELEAEGS